MWTVIGTIVALVLAFIVWRILSVPLGMQKRDKLLLAQLDPLRQKLDAGKPATESEVEALAAKPELRYLLFDLLKEHEKAELMPDDYASTVSQGESALAYWMMHPNELQEAPQSIECVETRTEIVNGESRSFHVYRYRMPEGHWAGENWILGIAGPLDESGDPYSELPGAFSVVGDIEGERDKNELIDWYLEMLRQRGLMEE